MASAAHSETSQDNLPPLDVVDEMNKKWKQDVQKAAACSEDQTATTQPVVQQYEASPDIEVSLNIYYLDGTSKYFDGNLNPMRILNELLVRLAPQLGLTPQTVAMSWSKKRSNGSQEPPVSLDRTKNLRFYGVETDDTIILREFKENERPNDIENSS